MTPKQVYRKTHLHQESIIFNDPVFFNHRAILNINQIGKDQTCHIINFYFLYNNLNIKKLFISTYWEGIDIPFRPFLFQ